MFLFNKMLHRNNNCEKVFLIKIVDRITVFEKFTRFSKNYQRFFVWYTNNSYPYTISALFLSFIFYFLLSLLPLTLTLGRSAALRFYWVGIVRGLELSGSHFIYPHLSLKHLNCFFFMLLFKKAIEIVRKKKLFT